MSVRKKLQRLGNSRVLLLDRDLLEALLPDGNLEQTLLVEIVGDTLIVRRETSEPLPATITQRAAERMAATPERLLELNATEQRLLKELQRDPGNVSELSERIGRTRQTASVALHRLLADGWVRKTGRDWRLTDGGRALLDNRQPDPYADLSPAVARLCRALEQGPATAAELEERLGVTRGAVLMAMKQATAAGVVRREELASRMPRYELAPDSVTT